jgi:hypothetical protein
VSHGYLRANDGDDGWIKPDPRPLDVRMKDPANFERHFTTTEAAYAHLQASIRRILDDAKRFAEPATKDPVEAVGNKADASKLRYDLLPEEAVRAVVRVLTFGAKKYSAWNWMKVPEWRPRYYAAAMRHIEADRRGEKFDPETGEPHLAHALCCLVFMLCLGGAERTEPLTHRPALGNESHTACGLKMDETIHLRIGDGETCARCTRVVNQVEKARAEKKP